MLLTILIFILVLGVLVLVHELGHFIAAKKFGMKVEEFGFWFPPRLFKFKKGDTTYSFNLIPIGGFVKIKGEDGENRGDSDSFAAKPAWQRAVTLFAGVSMNIVLSMFLIGVGHKVGLPTVVDDNIQDKALRDPKIQIIEVGEDTPAQDIGLSIGDTILEINGKEVNEVVDVQNMVTSLGGQRTSLSIQRGEEIVNLEVVPRITYPQDQGPLGIAIVKTAVVSYPLGEAIGKGIMDTLYSLKMIVIAFGRLISDIIVSGKVSPQIAGPVGVAVLTGRVARMGWVYILQFTALLSVNLAIVNVFPFPALDGGRLLFLGIESALRRPLNRKFERWANTFGFVLLMTLMLVVSFRDVIRFGVVERIKGFF